MIMLYQDSALQFSKAQELTGTAVSENVIDFVSSGSARGKVIDIRLVGTAPASGTLTIEIQDSEDGNSFTAKSKSAAVPVTGQKAGVCFFTMAMPADHRRFVRLNFTVSTAMTVNAILNTDLNV